MTRGCINANDRVGAIGTLSQDLSAPLANPRDVGFVEQFVQFFH